MPHSPEFPFEVVASPDDIDDLGHVSNLVYLRWVLEAARAHSNAVGWDHAAYVRSGSIFVVRRHEIDYLAPAYAGDRIVVTTWVESFAGASTYRRTNIVRADGTLLARANTLWAFVAIQTGRPKRISAEVADAFARVPVSRLDARGRAR